MVKRIVWLATTLSVLLLPLVGASAQQSAAKAPAGPPALTALDYIQIQQLVYPTAGPWTAQTTATPMPISCPGRYLHQHQPGPERPSYQGRELAALARGGRRSPTS